MITDQSGNAVWQWDSTDPFGDNLPNQSPNGTGSQFVFNLRLGGWQYYDVETGLFYNWERFYDPALGIYYQSDPIGLAAGQASTYPYVGGNPLSSIDPLGEQGVLTVPEAIGVIGIGTYWWLTHPAPPPNASYPDSDSFPGAAKGLSPADEAQKDLDNKNYHNTCDKPPPPGLSPCELARWQYRQSLSCQKKRQDWEDRWGTAQSKAPHDRALDNVKNRLKNAAADIAKYCTCEQK